jgi:aminoglycoside/choline kinase family phosphotransferase
MRDSEALINGFLATVGWHDAERTKRPGDASFRRYERIEGEHGFAMLMDAPPPMENVGPFIAIARHLLTLGYSAPDILAEDAEAGLLLLEDFGDDTFTKLLAAGASERELYALAVDLLIDLHRNDQAIDIDLPPYDEDRLLGEAALLTEWYLPAIGQPVEDEERDDYFSRWRAAFHVLDDLPPTLVLRDFHVDNLMRLPGREGIQACGLLDFQDALIGSPAYDLVSLLEDARRDVTPAVAAEMLERYLAAFPHIDPENFKAAYAVLGAQRNAKIIGIFTRLMVRDGKPIYLKHIPRLWRLLEGDLEHPVLADVRDWFDEHIPRQRRIPPRNKVSK